MDFPNIGDIFEGRYELRRVLGQGGFAIVFLATDREMSRDVVIKALKPTDGEYPETVAARFHREARVFTRLQDPHNITVYDVGESAEGVLYMVFEYVQGRELALLLKQRGPFDPPVVAHILTQLLMALREAHDLGILHRDIKPANVLVYQYDGDPHRVKLLDYGIAKDLRPDAAKLTKTGRVVGTLRYMAPEQLVGEPVTPASDMYSLGLLGSELMCGRPAIAGTEQRDILRNQVARTRLVVPEDCGPKSLRAVIEKLMERDPHDRYQSANAALRDLIAIRDEVVSWAPGLPTEEVAETVPLVRERPAPPSGVPWVRVLGVAAATVAMGAVAIAIASVDDDERVRPNPVRRVVELPGAPTPPEPEDVQTPAAARATPKPDRVTANDGCGKPAPFVGAGRLSSGGISWAAYIPTTYEPRRRYPLVLMFHRGMRDGAAAIHQSRMNEIAEKHGAILFAPDSTRPLRWHFTTEAVAHVVEAGESQLCIDPTRRYGVGDNIGAQFLQRLMCAVPMSAVAFTFSAVNRPCQPVVPTPRLRLHGRRDKNVPVEGGPGCNPLHGSIASTKEIEKNWKARYGCGGSARRWGDYPGGDCSIYGRCDVAPLATCLTDGGHQWPGFPAPIQTQACDYEEPDVAFPYAEAMWTFFEEFGVSTRPTAEDNADAGSAP